MLSETVTRRSLLQRIFVGFLVFLSVVLLGDSILGLVLGHAKVWRVWPELLPWLIPAIGATLFYFLLILLCQKNRSRTALVFCFIILVAILRGAWAYNFDSIQTSDFRDYWSCADKIIAGSEPLPQRCSGLKLARSVMYTVPIKKFFGNSNFSLEMVNIIFIILSTCLFFLMARRLYGSGVASMATFFFSFHPEFWYAGTLASHDIPGIFWLCLFFYLSVVLIQQVFSQEEVSPEVEPVPEDPEAKLNPLTDVIARTDYPEPEPEDSESAFSKLNLKSALAVKPFITAVLAGAALAMVELQRSLGMPIALALIISLVFFITAEIRSKDSRLAVKNSLILLCTILVIPVISFKLVESVFWQGLAPSAERSPSLTSIFTGADVHGRNRRSETAAWRFMYYPKIPEAERSSFAQKKLLHEFFSDGKETLAHFQRKNRLLANPSGYLKFASYKPKNQQLETAGNLNREHILEQRFVAYMFSVILLFLAAVRLILYAAIPFTRAETPLVLFCFGSYLGLVLLGETQARYDIFTILVLPCMAAQAIVWSPLVLVSKRVLQNVIGSPLLNIIIGLSGFVSLGLAWSLLAPILVSSGMTLSDQSGFKILDPEFPENTAEELKVEPIFLRENFKQAQLGIPAETLIPAGSNFSIEKTFDTTKLKPKRLRLFVSNGQKRRHLYHFHDADMEFRLYINDQEVSYLQGREMLGARFLEFEEPGVTLEPSVKIRLTARNRNEIAPVSKKIASKTPLVSLDYLDFE